MKQRTLGETGFEKFAKATGRAQFLTEMDRVVPWAEPCMVVAPVYPKASPAGGRPPITLKCLPGSYFLQQWFNRSGPAVEEALYDPQAMRNFAGVGLAEAAAPDETTACKFRQLLERHKLDKAPLGEVNRDLATRGIKVSTGTTVDATSISAPSSTKNRKRARRLDAPDREGRAVVLRDESAHRGGQPDEALAHGAGVGGQRGRQPVHGPAPVVEGVRAMPAGCARTAGTMAAGVRLARHRAVSAPRAPLEIRAYRESALS